MAESSGKVSSRLLLLLFFLVSSVCLASLLSFGFILRNGAPGAPASLVSGVHSCSTAEGFCSESSRKDPRDVMLAKLEPLAHPRTSLTLGMGGPPSRVVGPAYQKSYTWPRGRCLRK